MLRTAGMVEAERDGREVRYRLSDPDVMVACGIMRDVLERRLTRLAALSAAPVEPPRPQPATPLALAAGIDEVTTVDEPLNLVLFSGTDDKLQAAAVLTAGAAALGKPVNIFLQYWALDAFRADRIDRRSRPRARGRPRGPRGGRRARTRRPGAAGRRRSARPRTSAAVDVQACSLSMDLLHLEPADLDPLVDGVEGVTAFYLNAGDGQVVFI